MPKKTESYEEMLIKLEDIVKKMENEQLSLEDTMKNYEEGIKLSNKLYKLLNETEGKIKILADQEEKDFYKDEE